MKRNSLSSNSLLLSSSSPDLNNQIPVEYKFYTEFQSHESEFDYLKSLEIEEKINQIAWCHRVGSSLMLLSTNDKTIKLWKIQEKKLKSFTSFNVDIGRYGGRTPIQSLQIPSVMSGDVQTIANCRKVYANAHSYHINSISVNSDGATFLSADDLRINVWNLDNAKLSFNIVDIKPPTLEDLTEVVTAADFHPFESHTFMYASSRGSIKLGDMREAALCDHRAKVFEEEEDVNSKSYFSEIIASVSDIDFTADGRYIIARDYLSIKIWDTAMEKEPLAIIPVHEYLRPKLPELYDADCIFDKFRISSSCTGRQIITGSYNNSVKIYDIVRGSETMIELAKARPRAPMVHRVVNGLGIPISIQRLYEANQQRKRLTYENQQQRTQLYASTTTTTPNASSTVTNLDSSSSSSLSSQEYKDDSMEIDSKNNLHNHPYPFDSSNIIDERQSTIYEDNIDNDTTGLVIDTEKIDFSKKVLHYTWHPYEDIVAVAGLNNLYLYHT